MKRPRQVTRTASRQNSGPVENFSDPADDIKPGHFHLKAPRAKSVQLAAKFTEWEKSPLDMTKSKNGVWFAIIPLPPGNHPYRFIVDGRWRDDPHAVQHAP